MFHLRLLTQLPRLLLLLLVALQPITAEPAGYHYDRPSFGPSAPPTPTSVYAGHHFAPLPTVQPLPPVPALPPLPRSRYLPANPTAYSPSSTVSYHGNVAPTQQTLSLSGQPAAQLLQQPIHVPSAPAAAAQPLRIPFGKQALFSPGESYVANGRQLKQYAVIEIIDNDINDSPAPFLSSGFFDRYRAHLGATGTGATGSGVQLASRANALVLEQQALSLQPRLGQGQGQDQSDAIALGSGGLGYIRLPNGNVYLGSGSLGYISGQQRVASVLDARTRSESTSDALHFGHGPLGGADNFLRFK